MHLVSNQIVFVPVSEEVFWSKQMQRRRRSLSIESVVHETGQRGTGGERHIFRHAVVTKA